MGNDRELTQTSPVEERDSDSESDMPQLVEEAQVSDAFPEVVEDVKVSIQPDIPPIVESDEEQHLELDQPGTNLTTISESIWFSAMHRLPVMVVHSNPSPDQLSDQDSDQGN